MGSVVVISNFKVPLGTPPVLLSYRKGTPSCDRSETAIEPSPFFPTARDSASAGWFVVNIRVVIAYESRLARELVRTIISTHADFEVVGEVQNEADIIPAIEQHQADCLIVEQEELDKRPAICDPVFEKWPRMRVLALASGSERSTLYWFAREIRSASAETCEEGVINALRSKVESC